MHPQAYLHSNYYNAAIDKCVSIAEEHDPASPNDIRTQFIQALGEIAGIWPISCYCGEEAGPSILVSA